MQIIKKENKIDEKQKNKIIKLIGPCENINFVLFKKW